MIKLLGTGLVLISCAAFGSFMAEEKKKRLQSLRELRQFFLPLQGEIRYGGTPLKEAMETALGGAGRKEERGTEGNLYPAFWRIIERMEEKNAGSLAVLWKEELSKEVKAACLNTTDVEKLMKIGETLGYLDRETQLESLKYYLSGIKEDIQTEERTIREKVRLCYWLGTLAGVFISILMI